MNHFHKTIIISAICSIVILFSCSPYNSSNLNNTYKATFVVSEFKKDFNKSSRKFIGKTLIIIGRIDHYYKNKEGEIAIILSPKGESNGIKCNLINSHKQIKKPLKLGQNIIIKGKCADFDDMIVMKRCYIIP